MILIIEDHSNIQRELSEYLKKNGHYSICPKCCFCSQEQLLSDIEQILNTQTIELILLDIGLKNCDGLKLCKDIRENFRIPVIFVTGRTGEADELASILTGGDDFIRKPYSLPVLLARINRILARQNEALSESICVSGVSLNVLMGQLTYQGTTMELSRNEVKILYYLFLNKGHTVSRDSLIEYLWENKFYVDENILNVNLSRLRRRLKELGLEDFILTIPKLGFLVNDEKKGCNDDTC